jgi:hypothetical protein
VVIKAMKQPQNRTILGLSEFVFMMVWRDCYGIPARLPIQILGPAGEWRRGAIRHAAKKQAGSPLAMTGWKHVLLCVFLPVLPASPFRCWAWRLQTAATLVAHLGITHPRLTGFTRKKTRPQRRVARCGREDYQQPGMGLD